MMCKKQSGVMLLTSILIVLSSLLGRSQLVNADVTVQSTVNENQDNPDSTSSETISREIIGITVACGITLMAILLIWLLRRKPFSGPWSLNASSSVPTTEDLELTTTTTTIASPKLAPPIPPPPLRQSGSPIHERVKVPDELYSWPFRYQRTTSASNVEHGPYMPHASVFDTSTPSPVTPVRRAHHHARTHPYQSHTHPKRLALETNGPHTPDLDPTGDRYRSTPPHHVLIVGSSPPGHPRDMGESRQ